MAMFGLFKTKKQKVGELLSAYMDGQLSAREKQTVERLLGDSDEARRELESLRATVGFLKQAPLSKPLRPLTLKAVPGPAPKVAPRSFGLALPVATAAAALFFALVLVGGSMDLFSVHPSQPPTLSATVSPRPEDRYAAVPNGSPELPTPAADASPRVSAAQVAPEKPPAAAMGISSVTPPEATATASPNGGVAPTPAPKSVVAVPTQPAMESVQSATSSQPQAAQLAGAKTESRFPWLPLEIALGAVLAVLIMATGVNSWRARRRT